MKKNEEEKEEENKKFEMQANARFRLMESAKHAYKFSSIRKEEWINAKEIQDFITENNLDKKIAIHIAEWVWNGINKFI